MAARLMTLFLALFLVPGLALAHGPSRQKNTATIEMDASPAVVWAKVKDFGDLSWNPLVASTEAPAGNGVKSVRTVTLKDGGTLTQELYRYDDGKMSYQVIMPQVDTSILPVTNYSEFLTVKPAGEGSVVELRSAYYRGYPNNDPPENLSDAAANAAVAAWAAKVLEGLKASIGFGS